MKQYGLIGKSLSHSFSKAYFTEKFQTLQLNAVYHNLELATIAEIAGIFNSRLYSGFNVTIPYKSDIIPHLHALDEAATAIGAVNCISVSNEKYIGHNTDCIGFERMLVPLMENKVEFALVLGSGGASLAVQYVLKKWGLRYFVVSRDKNGKSSQHCTYEELTPALIEACTLIVNTTPVGQFPNTTDSPSITYESIGKSHVVIDLIYNPTETQFLHQAKLRGASICNGLGMLHIQAEESWKLWQAEREK
ncbi:MAG: shikimate dehydrogenase family protein [Bacteroidota bacterium]